MNLTVALMAETNVIIFLLSAQFRDFIFRDAAIKADEPDNIIGG
jgi:hypothetical protein